MFNRRFVLVFDKIHQKKWLIVAVAAVVTLMAGIGLWTISFDNDIAIMLPGDNEIRQSMLFLRESNLSDRVILSLKLSSTRHTTQDLINAADQLAQQLGPPFVTGVQKGVSGTETLGGVLGFLKHAPQLIGEKDLERIDGLLTPEGVAASLRAHYRRMLGPSSGFMTPFISADPLGVFSKILASLERLPLSMGYQVDVKGGHFINRTGTHTMIILKTPIAVTDGIGAKQLITYLREKMQTLPGYISADIVAAHLHTLSNETVIRRDVRLALSVSSIAFFLLFLIFFRDIRAVMLFIIPAASVLVSLNISSLLLDHLSYFIVAMGGVVTGIAIDYGIHVYMAMRASGGRLDVVKKVARPLVIGALTTAGVFAALFFSSVQGYHQLAFFSILSIALCIISALFVLPHLLGKQKYYNLQESRPPTQGAHGPHPFRDKAIAVCWTAIMIGAVVSTMHLRFNSDVTQFDGSEAAVLQAEQAFMRAWGGQGQPAVFVVNAPDLDSALEINEQIYGEAVAVVGAESFSSIAPLFPPANERIVNLARWKDFWKQGREEKLKGLLLKHGEDYHFSANAFTPFFRDLYTSEIDAYDGAMTGFFGNVKERFVLQRQDGWHVLSFFPDDDQFVRSLSAVSSRFPGTFIVSRNAISVALSRSIASEIFYLAGIAGLLILVLTFILLRRVLLAAIALVPVITSILAIFGVMAMKGISLNVPAIIAAMVIIGLCIDYGIFMVFTNRYRLRVGTFAAVTLSAVTTLIGAGALVFAQHPMLFSVGLTMVIGISAGYVSAVLVVPPLYRLLFRSEAASG